MKKKLLISSVLIFTLLFGIVVGALASSDIKLIVNGQQVEANVVMVNHSTYVPLRVVSEILGAKINWDASTRTVTISSDQYTTPVVNDNNNQVKYDDNAEKRKFAEDLRALKVTGNMITLNGRVNNLIIEIEIHKMGIESDQTFKNHVRNLMFPENAMLTTTGKDYQAICLKLIAGTISNDEAIRSLKALIN